MDRIDAAGKRSQRVGVRCDGELIQVLSLVGEQADAELLST
jgi:hypothetical protein